MAIVIGPGITIGGGVTLEYGDAPPAPPGQVYFTTFGTHTWTVPAGVTSISVAAVGAGGSALGGSGGGGGGLGWKNNIAVTPGQVYTYNIGRPIESLDADGNLLQGEERQGPSIPDPFRPGYNILLDRTLPDPPGVTNTVFYDIDGTTPLVVGYGGTDGAGWEYDPSTGTSRFRYNVGVGGGFVGDSGYTGGNGGDGTMGDCGGCGIYGGGGGGAATFSGNGQFGARSGNANQFAGTFIINGGRGGDFFYYPTYGGGSILDGSTRTGFFQGQGNGGAGGRSSEQYNPNNLIAYGLAGGLRIMWGAGRAYPSTNIGNV
jgi:hypothetical protein